MSAYVKIPGVEVVLQFDNPMEEVIAAVHFAVENNRVVVANHDLFGSVVVPFGSLGAISVRPAPWNGSEQAYDVPLTDLMPQPASSARPRRLR